MSHFTKRLEQVLDTVRAMPADQQDLIAIEMLDRVRSLTEPPTRLSPEERAELEAALAAARRGERATEAEVAAVYAKYGV